MNLKRLLREELEKYSEDNTIIGSKGYDITRDSKANALLDVLLKRGWEIGITGIMPLVTGPGSVNYYMGSPIDLSYRSRFYVGTKEESTRLLSYLKSELEHLGTYGEYEIYTPRTGIINEEVKHDNTIIGSKGYDIFKDSKAEALINVLLSQKGDEFTEDEEIGLIDIEPYETTKYNVNVYGIHYDSGVYVYYNVATLKEFQITNTNDYYFNVMYSEISFIGDFGKYKVYQS